MRLYIKSVFAIVLLFIAGNAYAGESHFSVQVPTCDEEARYVWDILENYRFFQENKYELSLPEEASFAVWIERAKENRLRAQDYPAFALEFQTIYDRAEYSSGYEAIVSSASVLESVYGLAEEFEKAWGFRIFDEYTIRLTLYGSGGSYDPDNGTVILLTTAAGRFKFDQDPEEIIVHEMTHIGIEEPIVGKFLLSHWEKERLVDRLVQACFGEQLPDYRMQQIRIDDLDALLDCGKWYELPEMISEYLSKRTRTRG